jgi:hypothetical protein
MRVYTIARPYTLLSGGNRWPLTSDEAQRLLDSSVVAATPNRVMLVAGAAIIPATAGGGPAFFIDR